MRIHDMIEAYREAFPDARIGVMEPTNRIAVTDDSTDKTYMMPPKETDNQFLDRISRSQAAGRNLFFEEWKLIEPDYESDTDIVL